MSINKPREHRWTEIPSERERDVHAHTHTYTCMYTHTKRERDIHPYGRWVLSSPFLVEIIHPSLRVTDAYRVARVITGLAGLSGLSDG